MKVYVIGGLNNESARNGWKLNYLSVGRDCGHIFFHWEDTTFPTYFETDKQKLEHLFITEIEGKNELSTHSDVGIYEIELVHTLIPISKETSESILYDSIRGKLTEEELRFLNRKIKQV